MHDPVMPTIKILTLIIWFVILFTRDVPAQEAEADVSLLLRQMQSQMTRVARSFEEQPLSDNSLQQQKMIVDQLELLVSQMSSSAQTMSEPEQNRSSRSRQSASSAGAGTAGADADTNGEGGPLPGMDNRQLILRAWGEMPAEIRERIGGTATPQFLPGYESRIRRYYEKMADEKQD